MIGSDLYFVVELASTNGLVSSVLVAQFSHNVATATTSQRCNAVL